MSRHSPSPGFRALLTGWLLVLAGQTVAQVASQEEPRWVKLRIPEVSLGLEVEGLRENVSVGTSTSVHEQLSLIPLVGLRTGGSIYHPNLLTFDFNGEGGWGWLDDTFKSPGSNQTRHENDDLLRYLAQVNILSSKPYNATFVASQDHTIRNYDAFSTYTVDSVRYAGRASWTTETLSLSVEAGFRDEKSTGLNVLSGSSTLTVGDLADLPSLARKFNQPTDAVSIYLRNQLSAVTRQALADYQGPNSDPSALQTNLVADLNRIISSQTLYDAQRFAGVALRSETQQLLARNPQGNDLARLNRLLLEDAYPLEISRRPLTETSEIAETYLNFSGTHKRATGQSTLTYRYDEFENSFNSGATRNSVNHTVSVSDSETFGSRRQGNATTGASYSQYQYSGQTTETVTANENITFHHRPKLDSFLTVNFSHSSQNPVTSSLVQGTAGVRHRFYDSLTSTLDAHGSYDTSSSSSSSGSNDRYGLGLHENYSKRLGGWGRLSLGGGIIADHEDHESSGSVLTTLDERHQLYLLTNPNYRPAFLSQPRVIAATIEVRGPGGIPATENVDYQVIPTADLTEIRLLLGSLVLHDGNEVSVNYQSQSLYNASFESFNGTAQIRLDLFNRFGVYGRVNWLDNNAPPSALTETLTDLVGGADFFWRWFRAGAEYQDYDSNFSQYRAWRFYQTFTMQPSASSTLGLDFNESFYRYPDSQNQTRYQALLRYNTQLTFALAWYVEGGYSFQEVLGTEQHLGSARTGLTWTRGKLNLRTGYQYNYQTTLTGLSKEQRDRNYFFVYLKRTF